MKRTLVAAMLFVSSVTIVTSLTQKRHSAGVGNETLGRVDLSQKLIADGNPLPPFPKLTADGNPAPPFPRDLGLESEATAV